MNEPSNLISQISCEDNKSRAADVEVLRGLLARLPRYLDNNWRDLGNDRALFGDGSCGENGIRTNTNIVFAAAVLLKHANACGLSEHDRNELGQRLRFLVRYLASSYTGGVGSCANGGQWGLSWQSSWWATKLALGMDIAREILDPAEREAVLAIVKQEANRHLDRLVPTGLAQDTKAEETAWDAESLAVALSLLPDDESAVRWRKRLVEFSVNTFSRPSDKSSQCKIDGIAVNDILRSCNIHEDGSLENHGAMHFCYVASPLLSKAWCFFALKRKSEDVPDALQFNVGPVWEFAAPTFLANRFAYIGGQDWARYTYGEYFILAALPYLASTGCSGNFEEIFRRRLNILQAEAATAADGSFYGSRFTQGRYIGQYAKYETDCFACVALALELLNQSEVRIADNKSHAYTDVKRISYESLTCYVRNTNYFFSFSWSTLQSPIPNINFVPMEDDSIAEWHEGNLIGCLRFPQAVNWVGVKAMEATEGGVRIEGQHSLRSSWGESLAEHRLSLELSENLLYLRSRYWAARRIPVVHVTGLDWCIPNDFFNNFQRRYFYQAPDGTIGCLESSSREVRPFAHVRTFVSRLRKKLKLDGQVQSFGASRWLNIDNRIGIVLRNESNLSLRRHNYKTAPWNSLTLEKIESPRSIWRFNVPAGAVLLDSKIVLNIGSHGTTRELAELGGAI